MQKSKELNPRKKATQFHARKTRQWHQQMIYTHAADKKTRASKPTKSVA